MKATEAGLVGLSGDSFQFNYACRLFPHGLPDGVDLFLDGIIVPGEALDPQQKIQHFPLRLFCLGFYPLDFLFKRLICNFQCLQFAKVAKFLGFFR